MLSKSNIRLQKSATEASIFYYIVSEGIALFRLSPQSAPDLVRFNKLSYILSHFSPFDNPMIFSNSVNFRYFSLILLLFSLQSYAWWLPPRSFALCYWGDFFKSVNFSPSSFVVSGCRWGKTSYLKILPNHFPCICLNAWGDFSYFSFFTQLQFIFLIGIG